MLVDGAVLTHSPTTATEVGELDVTVTGTLQVDATSRVDVTGRGFLGGIKPGNPFGDRGMTVGFVSGSTNRNGGSYGGLGGIAVAGSVNPVYGDFRDPNDGGSGGGAHNFQGGSGGGLIRIVAQTLQLDGSWWSGGGFCRSDDQTLLVDPDAAGNVDDTKFVGEHMVLVDE